MKTFAINFMYQKGPNSYIKTERFKVQDSDFLSIMTDLMNQFQNFVCENDIRFYRIHTIKECDDN